MNEQQSSSVVRTVYLYLTAFIGLILMVVGVHDLLTFLFGLILPDHTPTSAEYQYYGSLRSGVAYMAVGFPVWRYHWMTIQYDRGDKTRKPHKTESSPQTP